MTGRERVLCTIGQKEPDKVPKGELCIEAGIANRLLHAGYPDCYQHFQRDKRVRELLSIDLINLGDWPVEETGRNEKGYPVFKGIYGDEFIYSGISRHLVKPPLSDIRLAASYPIPDINKVSGEIIRQFRQATEWFVFGQIGGPVSMLDEAFGMEDFMIYALTNTKEIGILGEKVMEFETAKAELFLDSGADGILIADDIAFNTGVFLPPDIMNEIVYPRYKEAVEKIKKHRDVPVFFHSDGDLNKVMEKIVECGFDGLHSLQPSAGMDIGLIKKEYGDILCLMGNIDLDYVMTRGTPGNVEDTVKATIDTAAPGGGYIVSTCNTLVNAIPRENALTMYRTADSYGIYK